jgi:outer membrane protein assembly factor BamA
LKNILEKERNKIFNTGLFVTVEVIGNEFEPGKIDVLVNLQELWYIFPIPILELSDRNFSEWWHTYGRSLNRVDYGMRFRDINFRGRREDLKLVLQFGFTRKFELDYNIPYVNKKQTVGMGFKASYAENKSVAYRTFDNKLLFVSSPEVLLRRKNFALSVSVRNNFYGRHYLSAGYEGNIVGDTVVQLNPNYYTDSSNKFNTLKADYSFTHDERDNAAYPLKGFFVSGGLGLRYSVVPQGKFIGGVNFTAMKFFQISKNFYYGTAFMTKVSTPAMQPYPYMRAIGYGRETMRGFELNVIEGRHFVMSKNTWRYRMFSTKINLDILPMKQFSVLPLDCFVKAYFDAAFVSNPFVYDEADKLSNRPIYSGGVGIDLVTAYAMAYRFEFSYNSLTKGGFFFNMKTEF